MNSIYITFHQKTKIEFLHLWTLLRSTKQGGPEGLPILRAHQVVQDRVQRGWEEVQAAWHIHQVLVERAIPGEKPEWVWTKVRKCDSTRASCRNDGSDRPSAAHERAPKIWRTGPRLPLFIIKLTATSKSDEMSMSNNQTDDLTSSWFVSCFPGLLSQEDARPWKVWKEERDIIKLLLFLVAKKDSISRLLLW